MSINNFNFGEYITFKVVKRFGVIKLNRIHRANSFNIEQLKNLKNAVEYIQKSEKIRGMILTNEGNSFSTGMDLGTIDGSNHNAVKELEGTAADICKLIYNGKPAICAVNGRCWGEGVVFLLCCDYRIATKESLFYMPEILSGIFPGTGCVVLMTKIIGITWTKKMLMFAEKVSTNKALEIGLIDKVVDNEEMLMDETIKRAKFLSTKNQAVINAIKLCSNHFLDKSYNHAYEIEKDASAWYDHKDKIEFIKEFRTKINI